MYRGGVSQRRVPIIFRFLEQTFRHEKSSRTSASGLDILGLSLTDFLLRPYQTTIE